MRATNNFTSFWPFVLAVFVLTLANGTGAVAQEKILYNFGAHANDAAQPLAGLIFDSAGNLYGTTNTGGTAGQGTVFELSPATGGSWNERVLFSFAKIGPGINPQAGLILDSAGNLYGTARLSGISGKGVVFELKHWPKGWSEIILHAFGGSGDGTYPKAGLIFDAAGNLYGTTDNGGDNANAFGGGTVFELSPTAGGAWKETILHAFSGPGPDGFGPDAGLLFDSAGNLYGTTLGGGAHDHGGSGGTVFELSPTSAGWTETILHSCIGNGTDADRPLAGLISDASGNLYGTTEFGGPAFSGNVFELSPTTGGSWTETSLHVFRTGNDGKYVLAGLVFDSAGNLYGTTGYGGLYGEGTVFKLSPSGGSWNETVLHSFGNGNDGAFPAAGLILDSAGNLYGTTSAGGLYGNGAVFEITP